ncbi:COG1470 family protein [Micromonospora yangpuensis]|uniref:DUF916 domain-containing protein n=1 Tax=Micromonospora yangpuensis TaxID=683228 RepID=A0A1C6UWQ8_9ACTN|nr:DUF916 domain-containing protein [Micromonospora yangpuensis]GGM25107.1 hypothetical protein GCM10012279_49410 [Micromonospora yangpuensis]SCL58477.1 protein of unknown function [Micromonospora yangpuensis]
MTPHRRICAVTGTVVALAACLVAPAAAAPAPPDTSDPTWSLRAQEDASRLGDLVLVANDPGGRTTVRLTLDNEGRRSVTVAVAAAAVTSDGGTLEFIRPDSVRDPATWIGVPTNRRTVTVAAGKSRTFTVTIRTPTATTAGDYAAAVTAVARDTEEHRAVPLLVRVPGSRPSGLTLQDTERPRTANAATWPLTGADQPVRYRVVNTGKTVVAGQLSVGLATVFDRFAVLDDLGEVVLLPGDSVTGATTGRVPASGPVTVEARVRVAYTVPDGSERTYLVRAAGPSVFAFPWGLLAGALTLVAASTVAWAVARRRRIRTTTGAPQLPTHRHRAEQNR